MVKQNMSRDGTETWVLLCLVLIFMQPWTPESSTAATAASKSRTGCFPIYSDHDHHGETTQSSSSSTSSSSKHLKMLENRLGSSSNAKNDSSCNVDLIEDDNLCGGYNGGRIINVSTYASSVGDQKVVLQWLSKASHEGKQYYYIGNSWTAGGNHSRCYSNSSRGYHCECEQGYAGNPYSPQGCLGKLNSYINYIQF